MASKSKSIAELLNGDVTVTATDIADGSVITAKIADGNISTGKIADNAVTADKIVDNVALSGTTTSINGLTPQASNMQPFNRIINGAMTVDQRNAGATLSLATTATGLYAVDRFQAYQDKTGVTGTVGQSTDAPAGFKNSFGVTITTGATSGASDQSFIQHMIEGLNIADLGFGTANAQPITLSFWVKSSITGTNGFVISNSAGNRAYVGSYTVNLANTWEQKTVTIAGDTSGTWLTTNGIGIRIRFNIGSGSVYLGAAGSWGAFYNAPTGSFSTTATSGATFYITGVQLEAGSTASPFAHEDIWTTEQKCRRYYEKSYNIATVAGSSNALDQAIGLGIYTNNPAGHNRFGMVYFKAPKRANPTITLYAPATGSSTASANATAGDGSTNIGYCTVNQVHQNGFNIAASVGGQTTTNYYTGFFAYTAISEL